MIGVWIKAAIGVERSVPRETSRAELYRERAREVRAVAESCHDVVIKEQLLVVADEYDALARQVEEGASRY